jgi:formylglycine-generating enzyme
MACRRLLMCCVAFAAASSMIGTFALAQKHAVGGELGTCSAYSGLPSEDSDTPGMVFIRGGTFLMGSERHRPEERFTHVVRVDGFWIDRHEVTNAQFREFVTATGSIPGTSSVAHLDENVAAARSSKPKRTWARSPQTPCGSSRYCSTC